MAVKKISELSAAGQLNDGDEFAINQAGTTRKVNSVQIKQNAISVNALNGTVSGFATDTYLTGSAVVVNFGNWKVATQYRLVFSMVKTAAGTATPFLTVRIGTLGTVGDAANMIFTFGAGTAVADTGFFELCAHFKAVGSGTSAATVGVLKLSHHLAATGLTTTGASGIAILLTGSAGFNSTNSNTIGASFNGGAAFSGTCDMVEASVIGL